MYRVLRSPRYRFGDASKTKKQVEDTETNDPHPCFHHFGNCYEKRRKREGDPAGSERGCLTNGGNAVKELEEEYPKSIMQVGQGCVYLVQ